MEREEIEKELEQLPREWQAAFTVRVAVQTLPNRLKKIHPQYFHKTSARESFTEELRTVISFESYLLPFLPIRNGIGFCLYDQFIQFNFTTIETIEEALPDICLYISDFTEFKNFFHATGVDLESEFFFLKEQLNSNKTSNKYFYQPLYASQNRELYQRGKKLVQALRKVGFGCDIWSDWFQGRIDGVPTDKEFLEAVAYLPEEILAQEPAQINAYLKRLSRTEGDLNRVRVIFLGYGEAGKTSLIRALNDQKVIEGKEKMTPGIDILNWKVPETEITAHFWDFGGQVMAHATHQFFLRSQCLYILLLDGRTEINANEQAEYWLEHVRAFGSKAPVMLVGNKADLCAVNLDMARLKEKHPNVTEFYPLSCTCCQGDFAAHFQRFRNDLINRIKEVGMHQIRFLKPHFTVLEELVNRSGQDSFLQKTAYERLCAENGVAEQGDLDQGWLLDLLDKLGVILHFPEIASLDGFILNPRWLTYGVYTLLYAQETETEKGRLKESDIIRILGQKEVRDNLGNVLSYPPEKADIIIKAMELFKICFRCRHASDLIIIPTLLESDQPSHGFNKADSLVFEFAFASFLPRHVMPNFIVGCHEEIAEELVWQNGVVLQSQEWAAEALAQVDYHDRILTLWVRGSQASRYFHILHNEICQILRRMPDLPFEERVIVPEASRIGELPVGTRFSRRPIRANFRQLLAMEAKGRTEYDSEYGTFDLQQILGIMPAPNRESYRQAMFRPEINEADASPKKLKIWQQWWFISCMIGLLAGVGAGWKLHSFDLALASFALACCVSLLFNPMRRFFRTALSVLGFVTGANALSGLEANIDLSGIMDKPVAFMFKLGVGDKPWLNVALVALAGFLFWLDSKENK